MPSSSPSLAYVLPGFSFEGARNSRLPALERLVAYSREGLVVSAASSHYEPWQSELFRAVGVSAASQLASAPTTRLGATGEHDDATWLHVDPVRLETSVDGLVLRAARPWSAPELEI